LFELSKLGDVSVSNFHKTQMGIGLIELMISAVISLILISAIVALTVSSSAAYRTQTNHVRVQEQGRFAITLITRDIRMAGYFGCIQSTTQLFNNLNIGDSGSLYDTSYPIEGFEQGGSTFEPTDANVADLNILPGTDSITIRFSNISKSEELASGSYGPSSTIKANNTTTDWNFQLGSVVVLNDCDKADVFQVTNNPSSHNLEHFASNHASAGETTPGNIRTSLGGDTAAAYIGSGTVSGESQVSRLYAARYYVRYRNVNDPSSGIALYRNYISQNGNVLSQEIVEGVENLQFLYGVDSDEDGISNEYKKADSVSSDEWNNIVSVQVGIVVRSSKEYGLLVEQQQSAGTEYETMDILGESWALGNSSRYQRDLYTATVYLRN
jgi:type IV pilus assembly protein PilW